ncbi:MAG: hypothetical protein HYX84_04150 [Chloroflexi bacterium]|nr:hypothetical protein [Chloroflexota bacterium]
MRKLFTAIMVVALVLGSTGALAYAAPGKVTDKDTLKLLAEVRQATDKYHDVSVALAEGYTDDPLGTGPLPCEPAMGIHYVDLELASDLDVDEMTPEILLYEPTDEGDKLVGVEYFVAFVGQPAPVLFGRPMNGPMAPHEPGMPPHYDLHVYLWEGNPDGVFAEFNPNVKCGD